MSTLDLDAIRKRADAAFEWVSADECVVQGWLPLSVREHFGRDVPALLAEVERLRAEVERLRQMHTAAVAAYRELDFVILRDALGLPATGQDGADG